MSDHEAEQPSAAAVPTADTVQVEETVAPTEAASNNLEDALFGDDDEEEEQIRPVQRSSNRNVDDEEDVPQPAATTAAAIADDDEDDEDEGVRRKVRRPRQRVASNSASPPPAGANGLTAPPPLDPSSPVRGGGDGRSDRSSRSGSPYGREGSQEMDEDARRQLEYKEDEEEDLPADDNIEVAHVALPQLPVRRTKEHWLARIPHFLRYVTTPFDANTWDEEQEDRMLREEGFNSGFDNDLGAASLLRTSNTIRWRYTDEVDEDGRECPSRTLGLCDGATARCRFKLEVNCSTSRSRRRRDVSTPLRTPVATLLKPRPLLVHRARKPPDHLLKLPPKSCLWVPAARPTVPLKASPTLSFHTNAKPLWNRKVPSPALSPSPLPTLNLKRIVVSLKPYDSKRPHASLPPLPEQALWIPKWKKLGSRRNSKMPRRNAFVNVKKPIANRASLTMTCLILSLVVERVM